MREISENFEDWTLATRIVSVLACIVLLAGVVIAIALVIVGDSGDAVGAVIVTVLFGMATDFLTKFIEYVARVARALRADES